jgi:hypothetical protein
MGDYRNYSESCKMAKIIIGVPICESKTYIWDKLRQNLSDIQAAYPGDCQVVFAVADSEKRFAHEYKLSEIGGVLFYVPGNWIENIVSARNAIRHYFLTSKAEFLYMADCDMTVEADTLRKMLAQISGYDAVNAAYRIRQTGSWGFGSSPSLYTRDLMTRLQWRCKWWGEKRFLAEDELMDFDLFLLGAKVNRGAFVTNTHYASAEVGHELKAGFDIPLFRQFTQSLPFRFVIIGLSQVCHTSLAWPLYKVAHIWLKIG